jgi:hypothetical protein
MTTYYPKYRKVNIKDLEQYYYLIFMEKFHQEMVKKLLTEDVINQDTVKLLNDKYKKFYSVEIMKEIKSIPSKK